MHRCVLVFGLICAAALHGHEPVLLEKGRLLFASDFDEPLSPEHWKVSGDMRVQDGHLAWKGEGPKVFFSPNLKAPPYELPVGDLILEFSFTYWDELARSQVVFNDANGHAIIVEFREDLHYLRKWQEKEPLLTYTEYPDASGSTLKPGTMYRVMIEIRGTDLLARIDDENFLMGRSARFANPHTPLQLCFEGVGGTVDNYRLWEGKAHDRSDDAWSEWAAKARQRPSWSSDADPTLAYEKRLGELRRERRESGDPEYAKIIADLEQHMAAFRERYWFFGLPGIIPRVKAERTAAQAGDPVYREFQAKLEALQNEELRCLARIDPDLRGLLPPQVKRRL